MRVIEPQPITTAMLIGSNIPETDYAAWNISTAYVVGNRVIVVSTHKIYECVTNNTGQSPVTDTSSTYWIEVSATNRWKAFDKIISDHVVGTSPITYTLQPVEIATAVAIFGLTASAVRLRVDDAFGATVYDETRSLVDRTSAVDWYGWFFNPIEYDSEVVFTGVPATPGNPVYITITGTSVGEIVVGRIHELGRCLQNTSLSFTDYSKKERDDYGNPVIIERAFSDLVNYAFAFPTNDALRIKRIITRLRATAAVYDAGEGTERFGTTIYGFHNGLEIPLQTNFSFASLEIQGLT